MLQAMWFTRKNCDQGLNILTTGEYPPNGSILSMVCKCQWKAQGCQPQDQAWCVDTLLAWHADPNLQSDRGLTPIMEAAGAANITLFRHFYKMILNGDERFNLEHENCDGKNLYTLSGCYADDKKHESGLTCNKEIKKMVRDLANRGKIKKRGKLGASSARPSGYKRKASPQPAGLSTCKTRGSSPWRKSRAPR